MIKDKYDIVVIGAGIAGISAIKTIRDNNKELTILLISNEDRLPYKRTKINKHIQVGFTKEQFSLLDKSWYEKNNIHIAYANVKQLNKDDKIIILSSEKAIVYNKLLLATGAKPFKPEIIGLNSDDFFHVHFAFEVEQLMTYIENKKAFLIIGGGVEGLETADQLIKLGKQVTVIERNENPLRKLFPENIAKQFYKNAIDSGVHLMSKTEAKSIEKGKNNKYKWNNKDQVHLFDGIIICAGTRPNISLAQKAGVKVNKGILVNEYMQTSDANIFAAGDVAEHSNGLVTGLWHPAEYQGKSAGENMFSFGKVYKPVPLRLKTEVFGNFYFTANYSLISTKNYRIIKRQKGEYYAEIYTLNNKIIAIVMMNDKNNSKLYHKAVAKSLTISELDRLLSKT